MNHIDSLSRINREVTDKLLGHDYTEASANDRIDTHAVIEANEALEEFVYGAEIANLVRRNAYRQLNCRRTEIVESVTTPKHHLSNINLDRLGVVVVRPEALDLAEASKTLLLNNDLSILIDKTIQIDFNKYWSLYGPGMTDPDARYDFPTRTLNYINKDIQLIVVSGNPAELGSESVSDYVTNELKGRQGSFSRDTLRGDIAYTALKEFIRLDDTGFINSTSTLALDPIGAYRKLVNGDMPSDRMHSSADSPLLFYAGQAVHVPDRSEIERDSRVLLTEEDVAYINEGLQNE